MPKKTANAAGPKKQTKTAYVLSLPRTLSAKEVVAKGKAAGISLSDAHVYAIRSDAKKRKAKAGGKGTPKKTSHATHKNHHAVGDHSAEDLLKAAAAALGLPHALSILHAEYDKVRNFLGV